MAIRALKISRAGQREVEVLGEGVGPAAVHRRSISDLVQRSGGRRVPDALQGCGAGWCGWRGLREGERLGGEARSRMGAEGHRKNLDFSEAGLTGGL